MQSLYRWFYIGVILIIGTSVAAQVGFDNPYEVIYNHLRNLQNDQYFPGQSALSFPEELDSSLRIQLAKRLKQIYDGKGLYLHVERIPKDNEFKDSTAQDFVYFPFPQELPDVYVEREDNKWRYSSNTARQIPDLFKLVYPFGLHKLLDVTQGRGGSKFLGIYLWQYIGILLLIVISFMLYFLFSRLLDLISSRLLWRSSIIDENKTKILKKIDGYLTLSLLAFIAIHLLPILRLPIKFSAILQNGGRILLAIFLMLVFIGLVDVLKSYLNDLTAKTVSRLDEQLVPIVTKFIKIIVVIIALFRILHILDINVTALIAGISIGGLALALAAQDTVKNLLGSMMIFFDKPFQIGDYIISGDIEGSVTEVGFRSTRIKKPDTSIISIPNGRLSDSNLTNLGERNVRMMNMTIGVMYNTPVDNIYLFIERLRNMALEHPRVLDENQYIHLKDLGSSSIDIMFRIYIDTRDFAEELALKEEIIFKIISIAEDIGVSFAFPSSSLYIEQMPKI
jgi:MscS family membrane protein